MAARCDCMSSIFVGCEVSRTVEPTEPSDFHRALSADVIVLTVVLE